MVLWQLAWGLSRILYPLAMQLPLFPAGTCCSHDLHAEDVSFARGLLIGFSQGANPYGKDGLHGNRHFPALLCLLPYTWKNSYTAPAVFPTQQNLHTSQKLLEICIYTYKPLSLTSGKHLGHACLLYFGVLYHMAVPRNIHTLCKENRNPNGFTYPWTKKPPYFSIPGISIVTPEWSQGMNPSWPQEVWARWWVRVNVSG